MRRMSGTDSLFLAGETPSWHQHVGGLMVLDPSTSPAFGFDALARQVDERLVALPKLTWRLKTVPLGLDRAVWVDDAGFDLRRHLHRATVAAPGGPREVAAAISPILGRQLDRRFPLWEMWYLDGLVNDRVAVLMKLHHCVLDGGAGSVLATLLLDTEPAPRSRPAPELPEAEPVPSDARLLAEGVVSTLTAPLRGLRYAGRLLHRSRDLLGHLASGRPRPDLAAMVQAPRTSFNVPIGPRRTLAFSSVALADVRAVSERYGVKVNEVALAMCASALRGYLAERGELPGHELTAGVPVSLRAAGDTTMNNQLSYMVVPLGTDIDDPVERLHHIAAQSAAAKEVHRAMRHHPVGSIADTAPPAVLGTLLRLAYETHVLSWVPGMMNTVISNVPGPPVELYLAGARLAGIFTASVLLDCMGINFSLFTFGDRVDFGLHVDPDLVDDPWSIAGLLPTALHELMEAGALGPPHAVADAFGLPTHADGPGPVTVAAGSAG